MPHKKTAGAPQFPGRTMDGAMEVLKGGGMVEEEAGRRTRLPSERTIGLTTGG